MPFIISLLTFKDGNAEFLPVVQNAIDRLVERTKRDGMIISTVSKNDPLDEVYRKFKKVMDIKDAFVLFRCQDDEVAANLMECIVKNFSVKQVN